MEINKVKENEKLTVYLTGRLDTSTAPNLENDIKDLAGIKELVFDFANLEYISSAGLRVLLATQKVMNNQGKMIIKNANSTIQEVFDITGFSDILTIE